MSRTINSKGKKMIYGVEVDFDDESLLDIKNRQDLEDKELFSELSDNDREAATIEVLGRLGIPALGGGFMAAEPEEEIAVLKGKKKLTGRKGGAMVPAGGEE